MSEKNQTEDAIGNVIASDDVFDLKSSGLIKNSL